MQKNILIIEDESTISRVLKSYFEKEGHLATVCEDGFKGLEEFNKKNYDLICLDIMMPNIDGWTVAETIRAESNVPIIMMSALSSDEDQLKGYDLKIDDYVTKPFNPKILIAKAKTILDRNIDTSDSNKSSNDVIVAGVLKIDDAAHKVFINEKELELTKTEYDVLYHLVINKGNVVTREQLLDDIWGMDVYVEDRIVDQYIKTLRKTLGDYKYIKTVFGVGYRFEV